MEFAGTGKQAGGGTAVEILLVSGHDEVRKLPVSRLILLSFSALKIKFHRYPASLNGHVISTDESGHTQILTDDEAIAAFGSIDRLADVVTDRKTFVQELKPWSPITPNGTKILPEAYLKIFESFTSPGVIFSLIMSSISLGTGISITLVNSTVLQKSYNWSPKSVGLFGVGIDAWEPIHWLIVGWSYAWLL